MRPPADRRWTGILALVLLAALALPARPGQGQGPLDALRRGVRAQQSFQQGRQAYDRGDYQAARQRFAETVAMAPEFDEAQALLAWSLYHLGDFRAATIAFKAVASRQPGWDGPLDRLGWSRLRLGRHHLAIEAFSAALERSPDGVDALIGLGTAHFELGRCQEAVIPLRRAVSALTTLVGPLPCPRSRGPGQPGLEPLLCRPVPGGGDPVPPGPAGHSGQPRPPQRPGVGRPADGRPGGRSGGVPGGASPGSPV